MWEEKPKQKRPPDPLEEISMGETVSSELEPNTQNKVVGPLIGGTIGAVIGGVLLANMTANTEFNPWFIALGVGLLTGLGVRLSQQKQSLIFGFLAAILTLVGTVGGAITGMYLTLSQQFSPAVATSLTLGDYFRALSRGTRTFDIILLVVALFVGFGISIAGFSKRKGVNE